MHRRPFRKDEVATRAAGFKSKYSYVSFRVHPDSDPPHACIYLAGLEDTGKQRMAIFERDEFQCVSCGKRVNPELPSWHPDSAQWDHGGNTKISRCDCKENGTTRCGDCHRKRHNREIKSAKRSEPVPGVGFLER